MAIAPPLFYSSFNSFNSFTGQACQPLFSGVSLGLCDWILQNNGIALSSQSTGSAGLGTISGKVTCPPPVIPAAVAAAAAQGLIGADSADLIKTIVLGFQSGMATAQYKGTSATVASGADVAFTVLADRFSLETLLYSYIGSSFGSAGPDLATLCSGFAAAICVVAATCTGQGAVLPSGPIAPSPGVGPGINLSIF
jgi:hypothetical protein